MTSSPTPYLTLPGTTQEALTFYGEIFGCSVRLHTLAEFGRTDGPADAVAHGYLADQRFVDYYDKPCGTGATAFLVQAIESSLARA